MYLDGQYYSLYVKNNLLTTEGLSELDTYIFEENVMKPILNIQDSKRINAFITNVVRAIEKE